MVLGPVHKPIPASLEIKRTTLENMNVNSNIHYQIMHKSKPVQFLKPSEPLNPKMSFPDTIPASIKKKKKGIERRIQFPEENVKYPPSVLQLPIPPYMTSSSEIIIDSQPPSPGRSCYLYTPNDVWTAPAERLPITITEEIIVPIVEKCLSQIFQDQLMKLSEPLSESSDMEIPNSVLEELLQPTVARIVQRVIKYDCYYQEKLTFIPEQTEVSLDNIDHVDYDDVYLPIVNNPIIISRKDNPIFEVDDATIPSSPVHVDMGEIYNDGTDIMLYYDNELRLPLFGQGSIMDMYIDQTRIVYVTGGFKDNITSLDLANHKWKQIGDGLSHLGTSITGDGKDTLFIGGIFSSVGKGESFCEVNNLVSYQLSTKKWRPLGKGPNSECSCLAYDIPNHKLYIGGSFTQIGNQEIHYIGVYDSLTESWSSLEGGNLNGPCRALCLDSVNQLLYVGGLFTKVDEKMSLSYVGVYDLTNRCWGELAGGVQGHCNTLCICLNNLYVGGRFTNVGYEMMEVHNIARYDISQKTWHNMSQGVNNVVNCIVEDLARNALYVGGSFYSSIETKETLISVGKYHIDSEKWEPLRVELEGSCKTLKMDPNNTSLFIGKSGKNAFVQVAL